MPSWKGMKNDDEYGWNDEYLDSAMTFVKSLDTMLCDWLVK